MQKNILILALLFLIISCNNENKKNGEKLVSEKTQISELTKLNNKIKRNPDDAKLYNLRSKYYLEKGKIDSSYKDINKALQLDSTKADFYINLSDIYLLIGKAQKCKDALLKAYDINPDNKEGILKLAKLHLIQKEYSKSIEFANKAIAADNLSYEAYFIKGFTYLESADTAKAIKNFQNSVNINQNYYDAYIQLGNIFYGKKNNLAINYYQNAININPETVEPRYNLGMIYQTNNEFEKAVKTYEKIIKINPEYKYAYYNIAYINLVYLKKFNKAIEYFTNVINIDADYTSAYFNIGYSYELQGNKSKAKEFYYKTLKKEKNNSDAIKGLNRLDKK